MLRTGNKYILIVVLLTFIPGTIFSQSTSSPYSVFGIGILEKNSTGPSRAMGGTGIAFLSDIAINPMNPASYCGIDSLVSIFEVGLFAKYNSFETKIDHQNDVNANLNYIMMGFRIKPWLGMSFGFSPYSSVGYNINAPSPIEGTGENYTETFSGSGGVNQIFAGYSFTILKGLSLGINAAYLFGNITRSESSAEFDYTYKDVTYVSNFDFNYGLNYEIDTKDKWKFNLGLIYSRSKKLYTKNKTTIETSLEEETIEGKDYKYSIPQTMGAGFSIRKGFFRAGVDFERSDWQDVEFSNVYFTTRNSNRYSFGVEFPSPGLNKGTAKMWFFRLGGEYRQTYLLVNNTPIEYFSGTLGTGIPLRGSLSTLNVALELGQVGTTNNGLIRERYIGLHLDMSLRDLWFMKRRFD